MPRVVGQTEQARNREVGGGRSSSVDVDWGHYELWLPPERMTIVREIYDRMERAISERGLSWQPKLKST